MEFWFPGGCGAFGVLYFGWTFPSKSSITEDKMPLPNHRREAARRSCYRCLYKKGAIKHGRFYTLLRYGLKNVDDNMSLLRWARVTAAEEPTQLQQPVTPADGLGGTLARVQQ